MLGELIAMLLYNGSDACKACGFVLARAAVESLVSIARDVCSESIPGRKQELEKGKVIDRGLVEKIILNFKEDGCVRVHQVRFRQRVLCSCSLVSVGQEGHRSLEDALEHHGVNRNAASKRYPDITLRECKAGFLILVEF